MVKIRKSGPATWRSTANFEVKSLPGRDAWATKELLDLAMSAGAGPRVPLGLFRRAEDYGYSRISSVVA